MTAKLRTLLRPDIIVAVVTIIVAVVVTLLELAAGQPALAGVVTVLALLATAILVERLTHLQSIETSLAVIRDKMGLPVADAFYGDRFSLPPLDTFLDGAKEDILVVGTCLGYVITAQIGLLVQKAAEGCRIRLLMMNPGPEGEDNPLLIAANRAFDSPGIEHIIRFNLQKVLTLKSDLPRETAERISVKLHEHLPTLNLIFVDGRLPTGKVIVELLPHRFDATERPSFLLRPQAGGSLYGLLYRAYDALWEETPDPSPATPRVGSSH